MNELIFSDAKLRLINSLDKKSRIIIMAYENFCNQLKKMSKIENKDILSLNKSINLSIESSISFLSENGVNLSTRISENSYVYDSDSSSYTYTSEDSSSSSEEDLVDTNGGASFEEEIIIDTNVDNSFFCDMEN